MTDAEQKFDALKTNAVTYFDLSVEERKLLVVLLNRANTLGKLHEIQRQIALMKDSEQTIAEIKKNVEGK